MRTKKARGSVNTAPLDSLLPGRHFGSGGKRVERRSWADSMLAVIETLGALAACVGISLLAGTALLFVLAPPTWTVELPLRPSSDPPETASEVARRVSLLDLPAGVEVMTAQGGTLLLLTGLPSRGFPVEGVSEILVSAGYGPPGDGRYAPALDPGKTLRKVARPYLTLQAAVFLLAGWALIRFRIRPVPGRRRWPLASAVSAGLVAGLAAFLASSGAMSFSRASTAFEYLSEPVDSLKSWQKPWKLNWMRWDQSEKNPPKRRISTNIEVFA